ncbi:hypothetical protein BG53_10040 [Paenibacillus darwinianus]|uniref:Uncharacterized protein n=1 Tax=Paenibacillus darwinianus TaxID=1380763 RepID=A0A9W5RYX0_9BACL|nr:hypothetical protein [Paenibacillus darwinianus]EXX84934.1 hypothetical protein BG53_10040 [Paenibacillus darwinianus]EXX85063.1 hypothetical protein BG52_09240 [Paenibacillus darwinianus]EXX90358.1 hypothetical protein CH50_15505 [Paenibacillus darwinianus]
MPFTTCALPFFTVKLPDNGVTAAILPSGSVLPGVTSICSDKVAAAQMMRLMLKNRATAAANIYLRLVFIDQRYLLA